MKTIKDAAEHFGGVWPSAEYQGDAKYIGISLIEYSTFDLNNLYCTYSKGDIVPLWSGFNPADFYVICTKQQFEDCVRG